MRLVGIDEDLSKLRGPGTASSSSGWRLNEGGNAGRLKSAPAPRPGYGRRSGPGACRSALARPGPDRAAGLACGSISHMTELTDVSGAFGYGDSILVGERVRLRGVRRTTCRRSRSGRWIRGGWPRCRVGWPRRRRPRRRSASRSGARTRTTISASPSRRSTIRRCWSATSACGAHAPRTGVRRSGSPSAVSTSVVATARTRCGSSSATDSARWACTASSWAWPRSTPPGSALMRRRGSSRRAAIASRCCTTGAGMTRC